MIMRHMRSGRSRHAYPVFVELLGKVVLSHHAVVHAALNGGAHSSQLSSQPSQASDAEQPPAKRQKSTSSAGLPVSKASADKESLPASSAAPIQETGDSTRYQASMPAQCSACRIHCLCKHLLR